MRCLPLLLLLLWRRLLLLLFYVWSHFALTGGMIILELANTAVNTASIFYLLCSLQPRQAAYLSRPRQQAHNWGGGSVTSGCDPREPGVCCWCLLLLVLAAASAAAAAAAAVALTTTALVFFTIGHIYWHWYDGIITTVTASAGTGFVSHCMSWYE